MKIKENERINDLEYSFLNDYQKADKKRELTDEEKAEAIGAVGQLVKVLFYLIVAPILLIGFFCIECAKQSGSGSKRR